MIHGISAVTFAVCDMGRSVAFYRKLGFELVNGGERATFSSLKAGSAFVNLGRKSRISASLVGPRYFPGR